LLIEHGSQKLSGWNCAITFIGVVGMRVTVSQYHGVFARVIAQRPGPNLKSGPNHVECCTYPVLEWIAERAARRLGRGFFDPAPGDATNYRDKYAEIARPPTQTELDDSWRRARELDLKFETVTFERYNTFRMTVDA
jgi:hypothetical protein